VWDTGGNSVSLGRLPTNLPSIPNGENFIGDQKLSSDYRHYVFSSRDLAFAPGGLTSAPGSVYDNDVPSRTLSIASRLPNGSDIPRDGGPGDEYLKVLAVSADGSHILIGSESSKGGDNVYMRINGASSERIAEGVRAIGMTRSGSRVLLASNLQLTSDDHDDSGDIFAWSEATGSLTRVSQGDGAGDTDDCAATWVGKCGALELRTNRRDTDNVFAPSSGDVFFYSAENLDGTTPGVPNQRNLYYWYDGEVQLVTTLDPGTRVDRMQISPDGVHAAFVTKSRVTGYDNDGFAEMYAYDAQTRVVKCVSCNPTGEPPTADVAASANGIFMSDDGRTFFSTSDALVPQDTNGGVIDVYEFVNGRPQLITTGTGLNDLYAGGSFFFEPQHIGLESVSADGMDLYFSTFETLVPQDENGNFVKFYDARTAGGFPLDPDLLPCKAADECHGPGSVAPADLQVGSGASLDGGNAAPAVKHKVRRRHSHRAKRHAGRKRSRRRAHHIKGKRVAHANRRNRRHRPNG
jgi:hypothetical protein